MLAMEHSLEKAMTPEMMDHKPMVMSPLAMPPQQQRPISHQPPTQPPQPTSRQLSFERNSTLEERSIISSLFNEICIEAEQFHQPSIMPPIPPPSHTPNNNTNEALNKKLKKRKSELALDMTADEIDSILGGDTTNPNTFNPNNPFGPSPSGVTNGFGEIHSPPQQKTSPPLSKYSQNNQGHRSSPQQIYQMSPFHQMNSPMHSPAPLLLHHPLHHSRLLLHQQSEPNLRVVYNEDQPHPSTLNPIPGSKPFDQTLVEEFKMCVSVILMASNRTQCRNVYRQLTAEVSELYSRVVKNQVPKKAVKKIVATQSICTINEKYELERQFKCLSDGLASRQSTQLYESIVHFLYKMRIAIPDT